ncbi:MAG: lycopene cyclase family protein [Bacteroidota bacterium]
MPDYDYIIIGAGASGLLLADAMGSDPFFKDKRIALLEKAKKKENDRTWCFWEKGQGHFESILHKSWPNIHFASQQLRQSTPIHPYTYKMLRGIDFYEQYQTQIKAYDNLTLITETVTRIDEKKDAVTVTTNLGSYTAKQVFNSTFERKKLMEQHQYPVLQQHFIGWFVQTKQPVFQINEATFMDFSVDQKENTRFMYVLPLSETEALVEYTLFSETLLEEKEYEDAIMLYLKERLHIHDYTVIAKEKGMIPMTCFDFPAHNSARVLHIGIAGGWAKPSTGYTFFNSTKQVKRLVDHLKRKKSLTTFSRKTRFWYYDLLLLDVLHQDNALGSRIFESIFKKRKAQHVFKFLDEETTLWEEFQIINVCPKKPFLKALFRRIF